MNESPSFVVNRILILMINEAVFMLREGVASAEDIDTAMKLGANHPMGPLALADLIGLDVCLAIMELLRDEMGEGKYRPAPLLRKMVRAGKLGRIQRRQIEAHTRFVKQGGKRRIRAAAAFFLHIFQSAADQFAVFDERHGTPP